MKRRIVIVGGGIAGLATAWWLARIGKDEIVLVEAERVCGRHATAQNAAILRTPMPDEVTEAFARESARFLAAPPEGFSARALLDPCGVLVVCARTRAPWQERLAARADARVLSREDVETLAPHVVLGEREAWFVEGEGRIDLGALVDGFADGARALGVRYELGRRVAALEPHARGVVLEGGDRIEADIVVLAAGAWAAPLARLIGSRVELTPMRRHLLVTRPDARIDPRWPIVWTDDDPFYARPEAGGLLLSPCDEVATAPQELSATPSELTATYAKAAKHLRGLAGLDTEHFWAGLRTHAHDERFVIGFDGDVERLMWVAGLGGHGITCAAAVGALAAEILTRGSSAHPLAHAFDPARFSAQR